VNRRLGRQRGEARWPASSGVAGASLHEERRGVAGGHTVQKGGPGGRQRRGSGGRDNGLRPVEQGRYCAWATMASGAGRCGSLVWAVPEKNSNISIYPKYSNGLESIKSKDRVPMLEKIK
jgi:hypothetical protein